MWERERGRLREERAEKGTDLRGSAKTSKLAKRDVNIL